MNSLAKGSQENSEEVESSSGQGESELAVQVQKIREHLVFLEKKIDLLLGQSQDRGGGGGGFRKSFPPRRDFRGQDNRQGGGRPGGFGGGPRPFRPRGGQGQDRDRKPFYRGGDGGQQGQGGGQGGQGGGPGGERKWRTGGGDSQPFYKKRRGN